jgi:hypothetical protein
MRLNRSTRRILFWLGVILVLIILFKVLSFLVHLTVSIAGIVVAAILLWILYQAIKAKWL